jgi:hypothetical protein
MNFWSAFELQRKAAPKQTRKRVPIIRFRVTGRKSFRQVESQDSPTPGLAQVENSQNDTILPGSENFGPEDILSMLIEATERSLAKRERIPRNRRYPRQTPKSRMFARMLARAFYSAFKEFPSGAKNGVFEQILNDLLRQFGEQPIGEESLDTIISEQFPGV